MASGNDPAAAAALWTVIREWAFVALSALGAIAMWLLRLNWNKVAEDIRRNAASIEALYEEKADKHDVERRHLENKADMAELKQANKDADLMRQDMARMLIAVDKNVAVLLDRDAQEKNDGRHRKPAP